jgi:O-antigen/teichoic acid export membrane protein
MTESETSYRQIFKATSLFGGVQVFQILINIIRSKIIAVLLGPEGMGINGLLHSTTGFIAGLTNFGLGTSAVKNVAAANSAGDTQKISKVVGVLRRLVWITGLVGAIVTIVLSPCLSQITFGNRNYTIAFIWISVTLLLNQISTGQGVILRGTRQLKYMAQASLSGSVLGLIVSVPIYYKWGIDGIVPAIIISSIVSMLRTWYFSRKVKIEKVEITRETLIHEGKGMLTMGFMLSISGLITLGASYLIRIFISNTGGVDQVGLYTAGFAVINTYVGMVFTSMSTDYYPRLSGVANDNIKATELINQQSEIAILILAPILSVFIVFIQYVVILLYSTKFIPVNSMIQWAALGMYFKAASWAIAFILLAKGASKVFFWNEFVANIYLLGFNVLGYKLAGLNGLGISFLVSYCVYLVQVYFLARYKYEFLFQLNFIKLFSIQLIFGIACFGIIRFLTVPWSYFAGGVIIAFSIGLSFKELDKRLGLKAIWMNFRKKF